MLHLTSAAEYRDGYRVKSVRISPDRTIEDPYIIFNDRNGNISNGIKEYAKIKHRYTGTVMLEYTLRFSSTFAWGDQGGLLPGIVGGKSRCAKKESGSRCWRVQLTWNPDGTAGVALRLPQDKETRLANAVNKKVQWETGRDNKVVMVLGVNSRGGKNGFVDISINNKRLLFQDDVRFDRKSTRSKFVLRQGEYRGNLPSEIKGDVFRYISTSDVGVYLAKRNSPPVPSSIPSPTPAADDSGNETSQDSSPSDVQEPWTPPDSSNTEPSTQPGEDGSGPLTVSLKWTTGTMEARLPRDSLRRFDESKKELYLCSGDRLRLEWSGENMGVYGFYTFEHYQSCIKDNLNYIKNTRPSGYFLTKGNRGGWRYFAYITGADDGACKYGCGTEKDKGKQITGTCAQKLAVRWDAC